MNDFIYHYPTKQYFGKSSAKKAFDCELSKYGKNTLCWHDGTNNALLRTQTN